MATALAIHLLGPQPHVVRAGVPQPPPRGRKAWALLAYLLTTESASSRHWLAQLLFADADDPLNALSWNLTQIRRLLGDGASIAGDPVVLRLPHGSFVDVHALTAGTWVQAIDIPDLGRELLEGKSLPACPGFEAWLLATRRRIAGAAEGVLREAARARLSAGDGVRAMELASRLVAANPLDEDAQELLIRAYVAMGDRAAAGTQRDACVAVFRRELGSEPGIALLQAADQEPPPRAFPDRPPSRATTLARLEAGLGALDAGAAEVAISAFRQAVTEAHEVEDGPLQVRALIALGSALVHTLRGRDGEGAGLLLEAIEVAERIGDPESAAPAHRDLGYVELLRGRYDRAQRWLKQAAELAGDEPTERAWALAVQGVALTDVGHHGDALASFDEAIRLASCAGQPGQIEAWARTFSGRVHLLRHDLERARECLTAGLDLTRVLRWTSFLPFPEALLADVDLAEGRIDAASRRTSMRMPWPSSWTIPAGRDTRLGAWVWSPRTQMMPRPQCAGSPRLVTAVCGSPTPICGSRAPAWTPCAQSASSMGGVRHCGGSTTSKPWPQGPGCGSWSLGPTRTVGDWATGSPPRLPECWRPRSTTLPSRR